MRIVIVGQKWLGAEVFALCQRRGDTLAAVLVPPGAIAAADRLAQAAGAAGVPVVEAARVCAGEIPAGVDVILAAHAHVFITSAARQATRYGALGYHPSLLPRHRGRDAIRWALHMGDKVTGGSVYWLPGHREED